MHMARKATMSLTHYLSAKLAQKALNARLHPLAMFSMQILVTGRQTLQQLIQKKDFIVALWMVV
jgi:hypothetical protein